MTTTAEGVETVQQQELLRALGCSEMQVCVPKTLSVLMTPRNHLS